MKYLKISGLCLVLAFASSAIGAASAFATSTDNPQWELCEEVTAGTGTYTDSACEKQGKGNFETHALLENEVREISAKAGGTQKLTSATVTISCAALKLESGAELIGSKAPNPGTAAETIVYEKCEVEGFKECTIGGKKAKEATITTKPLTGALGYKTKEAAEKEQETGVVVFTPKETGPFVEFTLAGTCPVTGTIKVAGSVAAEVPHGEKHAVEGELIAPEVPIKEYFTNEAGKTVSHSAGLKLEGAVKLAATYIGRGIIRIIRGILEVIWWLWHS